MEPPRNKRFRARRRIVYNRPPDEGEKILLSARVNKKNTFTSSVYWYRMAFGYTSIVVRARSKEEAVERAIEKYPSTRTMSSKWTVLRIDPAY